MTHSPYSNYSIIIFCVLIQSWSHCRRKIKRFSKYRVYTKEWCGFKSWYKMYFSPYTGKTYTVGCGNCTRYSCATSSSLLMLTTGPRDRFARWRRCRRRLSVCSVLRCPDLWLQCSVSFVHGLKKTQHIKIMSFFDAALENGPAAPQ
jgi:hypothetical protein